MTILSLIAAIARDTRVIGLHGEMPWYLNADLIRFKQLTTGYPVIMGRKTHESIGRPLPNRPNIVLTANPEFHAEGCIVVPNLDSAFIEAEGLLEKEAYPDNEIFVIGGEQVYKDTLPYADRLYLTIVDYHGDGDAFFPEYEEGFEIINELPILFDADDKNSHKTEFWMLRKREKEECG